MQYIQQLLSRINLLYLCPFVQKILHLSLILCLVALTPMSAYAAGDSLTSSISLSFNSTKKFQLEAYEHFYANYTVPSSYSRTKNTLSVTVSNLSNFSISVMNRILLDIRNIIHDLTPSRYFCFTLRLLFVL